MGYLALVNGVLLDPEAGAPVRGGLLLRGETILEVLPEGTPMPPGAERVDLGGHLLAPGLLDVHFHGRLPFADARTMTQSLEADSASLVRHGTTGFLPTTVACDPRSLEACVKELARCVDQAAPTGKEDPRARPLGIHLEGPWIAGGALGAQPASAVRPYLPEEGPRVLDLAEGAVRMVTLAPEAEGAEALLVELDRRGVVAAAGHSLAGAESMERAVDAGLTHVTHLFNAMGGMHHREPGVAGFALTDDRLTCDLICDGIHVDPAMVRLAARAKRERLLLITDRIEPGGDFGAGTVGGDGRALRLPDGTLAGSTLWLDDALRLAVGMRAMSLLEAVAACTARPAHLLGIEAERGTLRPGARADLVVLDAAGRLLETWLAGTRVHRSR
jgi:N-acetylglucosamine-6-phosphate deacetylase